MKKLLSLFASLALCWSALVPVASIVATSAALTACSSTKQTAYKSIASVQAGVEVALVAWKEYVANRKAEIASIPEGAEQNAAIIQLANRELKARAALESYKTSALAAVSVARSGGDPAPAALVSAASKFTSATAN